VVGGLSWKIDSTGVPDSHGHTPRQFFPVWHNLYRPQFKTDWVPLCIAKYNAWMTHTGISGAQGS
jgi:hypothetical protein